MNIIFEGIDGVGKSTIIHTLINELEGRNELVRFIDEVTENSPITDILWKMLSKDPFFLSNENFPTSIFESLLLTADFHYRQEKYKHSDGFNLYDRDFVTILAYQMELLKQDYVDFDKFYNPFKEIVMYNLKPIDLLVYVHAPIETSIERITKRDTRLYDEAERIFLETVKQYLEEQLLPEIETERGIKVLRLDGRSPAKENVSKILGDIGYGKN